MKTKLSMSLGYYNIVQRYMIYHLVTLDFFFVQLLFRRFQLSNFLISTLSLSALVQFSASFINFLGSIYQFQHKKVPMMTCYLLRLGLPNLVAEIVLLSCDAVVVSYMGAVALLSIAIQVSNILLKNFISKTLCLLY